MVTAITKSMNITITGSKVAGPSWKALETLIISMVSDNSRGKEREVGGRLTRIARRDGGANYRATSGVYDITYTPCNGDDIHITLTVE